MSNQVKTKERVRELGEVYTNKKEVVAMLDLVEKESYKISSRFLEPACGNGNFLEEILNRKLETVQNKYKTQKDFEFNIIKSISSIYGIDISEDNIIEARERLLILIKSFYSNNRNTNKAQDGFYETVNYILIKNIFQGDTIRRQEDIFFSEFINRKIDKKYYLQENIYTYKSILNNDKYIFKSFEPKLYTKLSLNNME